MQRLLEGIVVLCVMTDVTCHDYHRCTSQSQSLTLVHRSGSLGLVLQAKTNRLYDDNGKLREC